MYRNISISHVQRKGTLNDFLLYSVLLYSGCQSVCDHAWPILSVTALLVLDLGSSGNMLLWLFLCCSCNLIKNVPRNIQNPMCLQCFCSSICDGMNSILGDFFITEWNRFIFNTDSRYPKRSHPMNTCKSYYPDIAGNRILSFKHLLQKYLFEAGSIIMSKGC